MRHNYSTLALKRGETAHKAHAESTRPHRPSVTFTPLRCPNDAASADPLVMALNSDHIVDRPPCRGSSLPCCFARPRFSVAFFFSLPLSLSLALALSTRPIHPPPPHPFPSLVLSSTLIKAHPTSRREPATQLKERKLLLFFSLLQHKLFLAFSSTIEDQRENNVIESVTKAQTRTPCWFTQHQLTYLPLCMPVLSVPVHHSPGPVSVHVTLQAAS